MSSSYGCIPVIARPALAAFLAAALLACQGLSSRSRAERLDAGSGMTVSVASNIMSFARTESRYSRAARDYIYLGPVETNRQGLREYYLWVGVATTLDRGFLAPTAELPDRLIAIVQDEPIEFELEPWTPNVNAYSTRVELQAEFAARVTLDQLNRIAASNPASLVARSPNGDLKSYERWDDFKQTWRGFLPLQNSTIAVRRVAPIIDTAQSPP